jgi:hypothetical protein
MCNTASLRDSERPTRSPGIVVSSDEAAVEAQPGSASAVTVPMSSIVPRTFKMLTLAGSLGLLAGVVIFVWSAHDFGRSCGWRNLRGLPSGPTDTGRLLLAVAAAIVAGVVARLVVDWRWRNVAGFALLAGVLAVIGTFLGDFVYALSRDCFVT